MSARPTITLQVRTADENARDLLKRVVLITDDVRDLVYFLFSKRPALFEDTSIPAIAPSQLARLICADRSVTPCPDLLLSYFYQVDTNVLQLHDLVNVCGGANLLAARAEIYARRVGADESIDADRILADPLVSVPSDIDKSIAHIVRESLFAVTAAPGDYKTGMCMVRYNPVCEQLVVAVPRPKTGTNGTSRLVNTIWCLTVANEYEYPWPEQCRAEYANMRVGDDDDTVRIIVYEPRRRLTAGQQRTRLARIEARNARLADDAPKIPLKRKRAFLAPPKPVVSARVIDIKNLSVAGPDGDELREHTRLRLEQLAARRREGAIAAWVDDSTIRIDFGEGATFAEAALNYRRVCKAFERGELLRRPVLEAVSDPLRAPRTPQPAMKRPVKGVAPDAAKMSETRNKAATKVGDADGKPSALSGRRTNAPSSGKANKKPAGNAAKDDAGIVDAEFKTMTKVKPKTMRANRPADVAVTKARKPKKAAVETPQKGSDTEDSTAEMLLAIRKRKEVRKPRTKAMGDESAVRVSKEPDKKKKSRKRRFSDTLTAESADDDVMDCSDNRRIADVAEEPPAKKKRAAN